MSGPRRSSSKSTIATAEHRPALVRRRWRHDSLVAGDLFSGFGGLTTGMQAAGFDTIVAANHNRYKVEVHEANHPEVEHWIADLVDKESPTYHDVRMLPSVDLLGAGVSCVNHTQANTQKAYATGMSLFDMDDPDWEERVTRSERDRATANCVLHYAAIHHPRAILVECTTELASWGPALPGRRKVGDGSTYRWWLKQFDLLDYRCQVIYLNSMFFEVGQSRNRGFWVFTKKSVPRPDLDHRPESWCGHCDQIVPAVWTWRTGLPPTGRVEYGKQYEYRCPRCRRPVVPAMAASLHALDLTDLGTRIGDKPIRKQRDGSVGPLAAATLARAEHCRRRFPEFPAVLMPAKAVHGVERHLWQPMSTQTSQQETALLSTGAVIAAHRHNGDGQPIGRPMDTVTTTHEKAIVTAPPQPLALAVDNFQGSPRGAGTPLPTQVGSETLGLVSARVLPERTHATSRDVSEPMQTAVAGAGSGGLSVLSSGIVPFRKHTTPSVHAEAMPTVTSDQIPGLLTAAGTIKNNGAIDEAGYRAHPASDPLGTLVGSAASQSLLFSGWSGQPDRSDAAAAAEFMAEWRARLAELPLEDCYFRMMGPAEVGRGCGFDVDFPAYGHTGSFTVWGKARDQVDGFGNAVTPQVGEWIGARLRAALHRESVA